MVINNLHHSLYFIVINNGHRANKGVQKGPIVIFYCYFPVLKYY